MAQLKAYDNGTSAWVPVLGSQGPIGPTGPTSTVAGPTGATGSTGPTSTVAGPTGVTGPTGAAGDWATVQTFRSVTASTDTPVNSDKGKLVSIDTTSGTVTITINTALALSAGERIDFSWIGATTLVTFTGVSTTINATPGLKLRARYSAATLVCLSTNNYLLVGDLSA
jgi:hypothetical protein